MKKYTSTLRTTTLQWLFLIGRNPDSALWCSLCCGNSSRLFAKGYCYLCKTNCLQCCFVASIQFPKDRCLFIKANVVFLYIQPSGTMQGNVFPQNIPKESIQIYVQICTNKIRTAHNIFIHRHSYLAFRLWLFFLFMTMQFQRLI